MDGNYFGAHKLEHQTRNCIWCSAPHEKKQKGKIKNKYFPKIDEINCLHPVHWLIFFNNFKHAQVEFDGKKNP